LIFANFSATTCRMKMIFTFSKSTLLELSFECFVVKFGWEFMILWTVESKVFFGGWDSLAISKFLLFWKKSKYCTNFWEHSLKWFLTSSVYRKGSTGLVTIFWICWIGLRFMVTSRTKIGSPATTLWKVLAQRIKSLILLTDSLSSNLHKYWFNIINI